MEKHRQASGIVPHCKPAHYKPAHYKLGLDKVEIDAVLEACELVGRVLKAVAPDANARAVARLLAEATRDTHHDAPLTRSILVEVARSLQQRDVAGCPEADSPVTAFGRSTA